MSYRHMIGNRTYQFADLKTLLAKATPTRSGDYLAGIGATTEEERIVARMTLAEVPLKQFLNEMIIPYEADEITRLCIDKHDAAAFSAIAHLNVGDFRNWLLAENTNTELLTDVAAGLT